MKHAPQKWVWHAHCEGQKLHLDDRFVEIATNLGWFLFAELNTVHGEINVFDIIMLKILTFCALSHDNDK